MTSRRKEPTDHNWAKIGAISGVAAVLVTIIIAILSALPDEDPTPTPTPSPNVTMRGTFENPTNQETVRGNMLFAKGDIEGFSSGNLLCILKNEESTYYPHEAQIANGEWTADVGIGPDNIGRRFAFTLILATATPSAFDELRQLREANPDDYYENGIPNLPAGIEPLEEVVFYRTP